MRGISGPSEGSLTLRVVYGLPDGIEAVTALAIGYAAPLEAAPEGLRERDAAPRERRALAESIFAESWGKAASWLD